MAVTTKQEVYDYVNTLLGGGMIDVELDPIHYETALKKHYLDLDSVVKTQLKNHTCFYQQCLIKMNIRCLMK